MLIVDPLRVRITGPLTPFKAGFAAELSRQGYVANSIRLQLQLVAHLSRWLAEEGLDSHGLSSAVAGRFLEARRAAGYKERLSSKGLAPLLAYLRELGVAPPPSPPPAPVGAVEELLHRYRHYLTVERGLADQSARRYLDAVRPFLASRVSPQGLALGDLKAGDVTAFVIACCPRQPRGTARITVTALRSLLRFLHLEGTISQPLVAAVPSVSGWRLAGLPKGLEADQVRSLLGTCDRDTAMGRRNFAIITMLIRLGLRAGEVAGLELDDVDWRAGEFIVRGKGRREERLPLPADVGEAIAAYLRRGRPVGAQGRTIFVRVTAPHRALSPNGLSCIVAAAARRAGLGQIHAHRLRHTAASQTLRAGASLSEVGQLLRHRHLETTAIYAKVDRENLREISRPWPGGAR
jgi:integrase/recombinase XerD